MENTDSTTTTDHVSRDKDTEKSKAQEVDLKDQMEKATEWAKKNPLPAGKLISICCNNNGARSSKASRSAPGGFCHWLIRARCVN